MVVSKDIKLANAIKQSQQNNPNAWKRYEKKQWVRDVRNRATSGFTSPQLQKQALNMEVHKTAYHKDPKINFHKNVVNFKNTTHFKKQFGGGVPTPTRSIIQTNDKMSQEQYRARLEQQRIERQYIPPTNAIKKQNGFDPRTAIYRAPDAKDGFGWKKPKTQNQLFGNIQVRDNKALERYYKEYSKIYGF
jgi:hypothetical protein